MDYKDKSIIINRFNDAMKYIAEMQCAIFNENRRNEIEQKRNAGEALSCAFEWTVKHHLFHYAINIPKEWKDNNFDRVPGWKTLLTTIQDVKKAKPFLSLLPNFYYLSDDKKNGRNISTHSGEEPIEENIFSFADEVRKAILTYVDKDADLHQVDQYLEFNGASWSDLYLACDKFDKIDNNYILIIGGLHNRPKPFKKYLSSLPWNLILDFDQLSLEQNGFYNSCYSDQTIKPNIIKVNDSLPNDFFPIAPKSHFHYFIKGYRGDAINISPTLKWNVWNQQYSHIFKSHISSFASKYPSPTKIIVLHDDVPFVLGISGILYSAFADRADFIILSTSTRLQERFEEDGYDTQHIPLSLSDLATGISLHQQEFEVENFLEDIYRLPHNKHTKTPDVDGLFTSDEMARFEEDMEVLHLNIFKSNEEEEERFDFLRGKTLLSWYGASLKNPYDVPHPKLRSILKDIQGKDQKIYYIKHEPGVGGTTFSRRLAWELHTDTPTVVLKDYRDNNKVFEKLVRIYEKTRERLHIIVSVPQAASVDDLKELNNRLKAKSLPYLIIAIGRDFPNNADCSLTNWGDDCIHLINELKTYLPKLSYSDELIHRKEQLLDSIYNGKKGDEKTPFYIALSVLEENFLGIEPFVRNFVESLKTPEQRKIINYLSLVQDYLGSAIPSYFFSKLIKHTDGVDIKKITDLLPFGFDHAINKVERDGTTYWSTRHPLFAKEFKIQLLRGQSNQSNWIDNLPELCIEFIEDSKLAGEQSMYIQEDILQPLFIGSRTQRGGKTFTALVDEMNPQARESVFLKLTDTFPENPHYCSHLARFYAYTLKNSDKALDYASRAIELSGGKDAILYHIRGMCYRQAASLKIELIRSRSSSPFEEEVNEIIYHLIPKAGKEFKEARKLQRNSEYGYVANIQMLIEAVDFGHFLSKKSKAEFLCAEIEPFADWLDEAATLLEEVKRLHIGEEYSENDKVAKCDDDLNAFYERYDLVIQNLNNQLDKSKNQERVRRQIVRFMIKKQPDYSRESKIVNRILDLMSENIKNEPEKDGNFYLWFQAARYSYLSVSDAIDKMARWKTNSNTLDAAYYFYILKVIRAIDGYSEDMIESIKLIHESRQKARTLPNNTYCQEWYGLNREMRRLVNGREVYGGHWDGKCELLKGRITEFVNDGNGKITLTNSNLLEIFFNPSENKLSEDSLNQEVEFYLGFSYDGLRAKGVRIHKLNKSVHNLTNHIISNVDLVINSKQKLEDSHQDTVNLATSETIKKEAHVPHSPKRTIGNNVDSSTQHYEGVVKIKNFDNGYIKCDKLDKDIAFSRMQLRGLEMVDINVNSKVYFTIKIQNGKMQTNEKGTNYKAQEVGLI